MLDLNHQEPVMLCVAHSHTDPYFNLAAEEYLLHNFSENFFMLWRNETTVVVGKHQNTFAEVNMEYVRENKIYVARRISGGGTVYHDPGNLNFTFIMNGSEGNLVDFKKHTRPIIEALGNLSVNARFQGRNDLTINGKKISGNAEHVYRKRVLHHGTLLFSSDLDKLTLALKTDPLKYTGRAVQSIRSQVTNIEDHLEVPMDILQFRDMILGHVMGLFPESSFYEFTSGDIEAIKRLKDEKYSTWEWIFGYSPEYDLERSLMTNEGRITIKINVSGGFIRKAEITGDLPGRHDLTLLKDAIKGSKHDEHALTTKLEPLILPGDFYGLTPEELVKGMF